MCSTAVVLSMWTTGPWTISRLLAVGEYEIVAQNEVEQLNQLMKKRDELRNKELLQAIEHSSRSFEEIMDFLGTDDSQD